MTVVEVGSGLLTPYWPYLLMSVNDIFPHSYRVFFGLFVFACVVCHILGKKSVAHLLGWFEQGG